ncbi:hypothetical protein OMAG_002441, partial [Candidatus Omnitrophus magneticus]
QNMVLLEITKKISLNTDWKNDKKIKKKVNNFIEIIKASKNMIVKKEKKLNNNNRVKIYKKNNYKF